MIYVTKYIYVFWLLEGICPWKLFKMLIKISGLLQNHQFSELEGSLEIL